MRGELGDLVAESLELDVIRVSRGDARTIDVHRRISLRRLYIVIFEASGSRQDAPSRVDRDFFDRRSSARAVASTRTPKTPSSIDCAHALRAH